LTQSFFEHTLSPIRLITFDLNTAICRNLPSFDPIFISTGLLDQYLFQGLSGGARLDLPYHIGVSGDVGKSKSSTDTKIPGSDVRPHVRRNQKTGLQLDLRYSKFNSSFGRGQYEMVSGLQNHRRPVFTFSCRPEHRSLNSLLSSNSNSTFVNSIVIFRLRRGARASFFEGLYSLDTPAASMTVSADEFYVSDTGLAGRLRKMSGKVHSRGCTLWTTTWVKCCGRHGVNRRIPAGRPLERCAAQARRVKFPRRFNPQLDAAGAGAKACRGYFEKFSGP